MGNLRRPLVAGVRTPKWIRDNHNMTAAMQHQIQKEQRANGRPTSHAQATVHRTQGKACLLARSQSDRPYERKYSPHAGHNGKQHFGGPASVFRSNITWTRSYPPGTNLIRVNLHSSHRLILADQLSSNETTLGYDLEPTPGSWLVHNGKCAPAQPRESRQASLHLAECSLLPNGHVLSLRD